jgi:hypothetical protein
MSTDHENSVGFQTPKIVILTHDKKMKIYKFDKKKVLRRYHSEAKGSGNPPDF